MKLDDSPESLDAMLRGSSMPGQETMAEADPDDMPDGVYDAMRDFSDAHEAGDHQGMAHAFWNAHSIAHAHLMAQHSDDDEE